MGSSLVSWRIVSWNLSARSARSISESSSCLGVVSGFAVMSYRAESSHAGPPEIWGLNAIRNHDQLLEAHVGHIDSSAGSGTDEHAARVGRRRLDGCDLEFGAGHCLRERAAFESNEQANDGPEQPSHVVRPPCLHDTSLRAAIRNWSRNHACA